MKMNIHFCCMVFAASLLASRLGAQDITKPAVIGGFENQGSVTSGYRFTDVNGYRPKYTELFGLNSGLRILDFSLFGKAKAGENRFADSYSLTLSGLGGEPYTTAQLTVKKNRVYDLRLNFRQSHYYWNRNDNVSSNGFTAITSNHDWATVRKFGSLNLGIQATNNLRFNVEYFRNTRDGVTFTTRSLDYFGSSAIWGSFARANPYYLIAPVSESTNRVTGGIDYARNQWNFHYKAGYQRFEDAVNGNNVTPGQRSINVNDITTAAELLSAASWTDYRRLSTPVSEFSYNGNVVPRLEARGSYLYYRYSGPASLDMSANGIARTNSSGTTDAPYAFSLSTRATNSEPNHVLDQGFTYKITEWWSVLTDYRYSRFTVDSNALFRSVNANVVAEGTARNQWKIGTSTVDFRMAFTPLPSLSFDAGVRLFKSDIEYLQEGVVDTTRTKRIKSVWPALSVFYQPSKMITIRGDIEETNNGTSYTRITPHTDVGGRVVLRIRPGDKLYFENTFVARNRKQLAADYESTIRSNSTAVTWEFSERVSVFAGFAYDSFFASDYTTFLRGTPPLTNSLRDQTVNRVWQGGFRLSPVKRLGVDFAGNFVRSTGSGEIAGEPALYGPMTFPYATGAIHYDFPRVGRLAIELQRTYYIEQIITANNFGAKLLTILWTYNF